MSDNHDYQWAVIGAGPAGMAAVGQLLKQNMKDYFQCLQH